MKKINIAVALAAGLLAGAATSANAADLGGNCCADLEERIAELEATTARKGNRKVSLTVSGWVTQNIMWWDDGEESNTYVFDSGTTIASHVKFTGSAQISPGWSAGYVLHLEATGSDSIGSNGPDQDTASANNVLTGTPRGVSALQSFWFVKSDTLGKVSVGLQSQASDNTAILVDGSGSLVPANFVAFDYIRFSARNAGGGLGPTFGSLMGCTDCNGIPLNSVRYDSPTFGGFSVSASWGEDDFWDIAARYAGEMGGFKLAVATAYSESRDATAFNQADQSEFFQIGAYIQHVASGIFLYGAYGELNEGDGAAAGSIDNNFFYIKAGLRGKWNPHGATVLYGEYERSENDAGSLDAGTPAGVSVNGFPFAAVAPARVTDDSEVTLWGLGVVQEIDAAAMSLWLTYRHIETDASLGGASVNFDDFDYVKAGALINF
jgi:predicted porin